MIFSKCSLALVATALLAALPLTQAISSNEIPEKTPINQLIASAKAQLAAGEANDALTYFDVAVSRDPKNYLTLFQRGATYLSLGRTNKAIADFDKVLEIKPDFEGALMQRAKLRSRDAQWEAAKTDYKRAGKEGTQEWTDLLEAEGAATLAVAAEKSRDFEQCVQQAGVALLVAGTNLSLRQLRARCRFERGEVLEGVSDLQHVLQGNKENIGPHLQISASLFYSMADMEKGLSQLAKCLQSDPDSKPCSKLRKQEKRIDKLYKQILKLESKKQFNSAVKLLVGEGEEAGLLQDVSNDMKQLRAEGTVHPRSPDGLYAHLLEMTCDFYVEMNNKKRAATYCTELLRYNQDSLPALIHKAQSQIDGDEFEPAINTLNHAKEHHGQTNKINDLLQKAHTLRKRSKNKDYYKVLGVARDADERQIKKAYRAAVKQYHPDKAAAQGIPKEDADKKIVALNEAYEVLTDPEKKAQFDRGEDPNDPQGGTPFQGSPFGRGPGGQPVFFQQGGSPFGGGGGGAFQFQQGGFQFNFG